ncbi:hypothetical protein HDU89_001651 [Geranomyces variabilis]|nr:hypothetical protein HDU89_001651 [Geranomyces variabilis]
MFQDVGLAARLKEIEARDDTGLTAYRIVPLDSAPGNVVRTSFRDKECGINEVREVLKSRTAWEPRAVFPVIAGHKSTVFGCLDPPAVNEIRGYVQQGATALLRGVCKNIYSGNTSEYRYRSLVIDPLFEYMFEESSARDAARRIRSIACVLPPRPRTSTPSWFQAPLPVPSHIAEAVFENMTELRPFVRSTPQKIFLSSFWKSSACTIAAAQISDAVVLARIAAGLENKTLRQRCVEA